MAEWTQVNIRRSHFDALAKRAEKNHRTAAAELVVILEEAGVIKAEVPARA